jgi:hypothetical protein
MGIVPVINVVTMFVTMFKSPESRKIRDWLRFYEHQQSPIPFNPVAPKERPANLS